MASLFRHTYFQILYYDKNPGISYEFTLPNNVPFTPFDGTFPKQNAALETSSLLPSHRHQQSSDPSHRRRHKQQRFHFDFASPSNSSEFEGEYYTGSQVRNNKGLIFIIQIPHGVLGYSCKYC